MLETTEDSAASALAVPVPVTAPLWKAPRSVADTQSPIKLETVTDFDSSFIPYEIEMVDKSETPWALCEDCYKVVQIFILKGRT